MMKIRSKKVDKSSSVSGLACAGKASNDNFTGGDIEWEVRPGGMLVQKRNNGLKQDRVGQIITVKVSTGSQMHDVSIEATSTFGELKMMLSVETSLEPRKQRLLFRGKEREDTDHLHMVGVKDMDKILILEDPAYIEKKLMGMSRKVIRQQHQPISE